MDNFFGVVEEAREYRSLFHVYNNNHSSLSNTEMMSAEQSQVTIRKVLNPYFQSEENLTMYQSTDTELSSVGQTLSHPMPFEPLPETMVHELQNLSPEEREQRQKQIFKELEQIEEQMQAILRTSTGNLMDVDVSSNLTVSVIPNNLVQMVDSPYNNESNFMTTQNQSHIEDVSSNLTLSLIPHNPVHIDDSPYNNETRLMMPQIQCQTSPTDQNSSNVFQPNHTLFNQHPIQPEELSVNQNPEQSHQDQNQSFSTIDILKERMKAPGHSCIWCGKSYKYTKDLEHHLNTQHPYMQKNANVSNEHKNIGIFKCRECGKRFQRISKLQHHIRFHKTFPSFLCGKCFMPFRHAKDFSKHINQNHKEHKYDSIYNCNYCEYSSRYLAYVNVHLQAHEKSYYSL